MIRALATALALSLAGPAFAGVTCDQGQGSITGQDWAVSLAARSTGRTTEVTVTNAAGGTTLTNAATALVNRKAVEIQNLGPNPIYCTIDGTAPVVLKARRIDALGATASSPWSIDAGPNIVIRCIAATAAQATTAATIVSEVR